MAATWRAVLPWGSKTVQSARGISWSSFFSLPGEVPSSNHGLGKIPTEIDTKEGENS